MLYFKALFTCDVKAMSGERHGSSSRSDVCKVQPVRVTVAIDTMLNFDGDVDVTCEQECKQTFNILLDGYAFCVHRLCEITTKKLNSLFT